MNRLDPDGRDSFFVARPLSLYDGAHHGFVITTSVGAGGRQGITSRFSFGPASSSNDSALINVTGNLSDTARADAAFASSVVSFLNGDTDSLPDSLFISQINAPDALVQAVGSSIIGNKDYETVPSAQPGPGANSNSGSVGLARIATGLAGNKLFTPPEGAFLPGSDAIANLDIDKKQLNKDVKACRADKSC